MWDDACFFRIRHDEPGWSVEHYSYDESPKVESRKVATYSKAQELVESWGEELRQNATNTVQSDEDMVRADQIRMTASQKIGRMMRLARMGELEEFQEEIQDASLDGAAANAVGVQSQIALTKARGVMMQIQAVWRLPMTEDDDRERKEREDESKRKAQEDEFEQELLRKVPVPLHLDFHSILKRALMYSALGIKNPQETAVFDVGADKMLGFLAENRFNEAMAVQRKVKCPIPDEYAQAIEAQRIENRKKFAIQS